MAFPPTIAATQWREVSSCRSVCPNAYSSSIVEMFNFALRLPLIFMDTQSRSSDINSICTVSLTICLFKWTESSAILTDPSLLRVMTTGLTNVSSLSFVSFQCGPFLRSFSSLEPRVRRLFSFGDPTSAPLLSAVVGIVLNCLLALSEMSLQWLECR